MGVSGREGEWVDTWEVWCAWWVPCREGECVEGSGRQRVCAHEILRLLTCVCGETGGQVCSGSMWGCVWGGVRGAWRWWCVGGAGGGRGGAGGAGSITTKAEVPPGLA